MHTPMMMKIIIYSFKLNNISSGIFSSITFETGTEKAETEDGSLIS